MPNKKKDTRRIINLGGKYNRKIVQSELHPDQYHDISVGYAKYNKDWPKVETGPPLRLANDDAIRGHFKREAALRKSAANKARGTKSSTTRKIIK
jgi:hypothetical protein